MGKRKKRLVKTIIAAIVAEVRKQEEEQKIIDEKNKVTIL